MEQYTNKLHKRSPEESNNKLYEQAKVSHMFNSCTAQHLLYCILNRTILLALDEKAHCFLIERRDKTAGLGTVFFSVRYVLFFSVLFSNFWRLMRPKRTFHSFPFFSKEQKRMQRMQRSFAKNGKEHKECNVLLQRTRERLVLLQKNAKTFRSFFNIYINICI